MVSPRLISPSVATHFSALVGASSATVRRVVEDRSAVVHRASIHDIAAGHPLRCGHRLRLVFPLERHARTRQVECVHDVGKRSDDVHRVVDDERRSRVPADEPGREGRLYRQLFHGFRRDLVERAEPGAREVFCGSNPVAAVVARRNGTGGGWRCRGRSGCGCLGDRRRTAATHRATPARGGELVVAYALTSSADSRRCIATAWWLFLMADRLGSGCYTEGLCTRT